MKRMALSTFVKQYGAELVGLYLSEVEIVGGYVSKVVETYVIDIVMLAYGSHTGTTLKFVTTQLVSKIAAEIVFDQGTEDVEVEGMDLDAQAATSTILLPDGTIWFADTEEGQSVYWCIYSPDHPLLPGQEAAKLA